MRVTGLTADVQPLVVRLGAGEREYALLVAWDAFDRARAVDAVVMGSAEAMTRAALAVVRGWQGIVDEHGRVVPVEAEIDGRKRDMRPRVLGTLTLAEQHDAVAAVLAAMGIAEARGAIGASVDVGPTSPPAETGRSDASAGG